MEPWDAFDYHRPFFTRSERRRWRARLGYVRSGRMGSGRWSFVCTWDEDGLELRAFAWWVRVGRVP